MSTSPNSLPARRAATPNSPPTGLDEAKRLVHATAASGEHLGAQAVKAATPTLEAGWAVAEQAGGQAVTALDRVAESSGLASFAQRQLDKLGGTFPGLDLVEVDAALAGPTPIERLSRDIARPIIADAEYVGGKVLSAIGASTEVLPYKPFRLNLQQAASLLGDKSFLNDPKQQQAVATAVAALPAAARSQYQALDAQLTNHSTARASLQRLLLDNKLTQRDRGPRRQTLMANLAALAAGPVSKDLSPAQHQLLVVQLLGELGNPTAISQGTMDTCGATTAQILMANQDPAELTRLVRGLASAQGQVRLHDGTWLERDKDWLKPGDKRTLSSKLIQPAFMARASITGTYSNKDDGATIPLISDWFKGAAMPGLMPWQMPGLLHALTGKQYDLHVTGDDHKGDWRNGTPQAAVPVVMNFATSPGEVGPHWVQVIGHDDKKNTVTIINPWGEVDLVPTKAFEQHLLGTVSPA